MVKTIRVMTEKDKKLIEDARHLSWDRIDEDEAETEEGREILHKMIMDDYHREEALAGIL